MSSELTEMAGAAEANTESAYAWGLDYGDPDEFPTVPVRLTSQRITVLAIAASLIVTAAAAAVALLVLRAPDPASTPAPAVAVTVAQPAPTVAVVLPDNPPPNSGCSGAVVGHSDVKHPQFGMVRVFLFFDKSRSTGPHPAGCAQPVTHAGTVLSEIWIDAFVGNEFRFASPAVDATGNMFINYQDSSNAVGNGLVVLIPSTDGFENVVSYQQMLQGGGQYFTGVNNYYGAELIGPANGVYTIRQSMNTCNPYCAAGNLIVRNLHWDGRQYVTDAPAPPPAPVQTPPPPIKTAAPVPQAGCAEHASKYSPASDLTYTCENGTWHEGPYGYGGGQ